MGARGRKSSAEIDMSPPLALVPPSLPVELPAPPEHLSAEMQHWWRAIVADFDLDSHHLRLLECACDAWDRMTQARATITDEGLTVEGATGKRTHPAVNIERDARASFARLIRELDLDEPAPSPARYMAPPALRSNRRR
jgi:P27 family predicted phage terminase small subunit